MVKKIHLLIILLSMETGIKAQSTIPGEYYLRGVTEVGSGFLIKPDSTFEFFFAYGALDRGGSGKWEVKGNDIVFNSRPRPLLDFALTDSKTVPDNFITIKITDANELLQRYVFAKLKFADTTMEDMSNEKGEIKFPRAETESLALQFQFCPEKTSVFKLGKEHNYFEFRFEPWITEYFFANFHLTLDGKDMRGKHPLLDEKEYRFVKSK